MNKFKFDTCDCEFEFGDILPDNITTSTLNEKTVWTNSRGQSVFEEVWRDGTKWAWSKFKQDGKNYKGYLVLDINGDLIPHSNFNVINLNQESENFKSAIQCCNLHKLFTGNSLGTKVIEHNRSFVLDAIRPVELDEDFENDTVAKKQMLKHQRLMKENPTRTDIPDEIKIRNEKIIDYFAKLDKNTQDKSNEKERIRKL